MVISGIFIFGILKEKKSYSFIFIWIPYLIKFCSFMIFSKNQVYKKRLNIKKNLLKSLNFVVFPSSNTISQFYNKLLQYSFVLNKYLPRINKYLKHSKPRNFSKSI